MGATGAGKSTLMDVLAGRKTQGIVRGDITVNGHAKEQATWVRIAAVALPIIPDKTMCKRLHLRLPPSCGSDSASNRKLPWSCLARC